MISTRNRLNSVNSQDSRSSFRIERAIINHISGHCLGDVLLKIINQNIIETVNLMGKGLAQYLWDLWRIIPDRMQK